MSEKFAKRNPAAESRRPVWTVYILECRNGYLYTGITNDLEKRFQAHRQGKGGRYTRAFGVKRLAYKEEASSRSAALKREARIKKLPRPEKLRLCEG